MLPPLVGKLKHEAVTTEECDALAAAQSGKALPYKRACVHYNTESANLEKANE